MEHARTEVQYDPFSYSMIEDPFPTYRALRDHAPIYYNEERNFWALSRCSDIQTAAQDWKTFSSARGVDLDFTGHDIFGPNFLELDPPRHDELRKIVRKTFSSKSVQLLETRIRHRAETLVGEFAEEGVADLAQDLAWPLPIGMICELLGVPEADQPMLETWFQTAMTRHVGDPQIPPAALDAARAMREYFVELAEDRREHPRGDVVSDIAAATVDGEPLGEEVVVGMCFLLFSAGNETTASLITNSLLLLARHPDQRARMATSTGLIPGAVEELLRYESPVQSMGRVTTREVEMHGQMIPADTMVLLLYGSANRDEREFVDPERLDVTRPPKRHLAFGEGIHFCLGAPLARLEAKVAFETFLRQIPDYEVVEPVKRLIRHNVRGLTSLPVRFDPTDPRSRR